MKTLTDFQTLVIATQTPAANTTPSQNPVFVIAPKITPAPINDPVPNIAAVTPDEPAAGNTGLFVIVGIGVASALLFTSTGKKMVSGVLGGKKKKGKNKGSLLPILLVGGAAAYYFLNKDEPAQSNAPTAPPQTDNQPGTTVPAVNTVTPPLVTAVEIAQPARAATALTSLQSLQRDWPAYATVLGTMTDMEVLNMYQYFYGYVLPGNALHRLPPVTGSWPDGSWNTQLYDAIAAIKSKYFLNNI